MYNKSINSDACYARAGYATRYISVRVYPAFKYRQIGKYLILGLMQSEIYFCPRDDLNDPHDCNVDVERIVENIVTGSSGKKKARFERLYKDKALLRGLREGASTLGIFSCSLTNQETLMWAHYADNHRGLCLRYDFPESFLADDESNPIMGTSAVNYGDSVISAWIEENISQYEESRKQFGMALTRELVTCKGLSWSYEREVRIIAMHQGSVSIPKEYLTHVIFGLRTPGPREKEVLEILKDQYPHVKVGRVVREDTDFGLDTVEI